MQIALLYPPRSTRKIGKVIQTIARRGHTYYDWFTHKPNATIPDAAYARTITRPPWRVRVLRGIKWMQQHSIPAIPGPEAVLLYDDKAAQAATMLQWMPPTEVILSKERALAKIDEMEYPFISKSKQGAASRNVRLISSKQQAKAEVDAAFNGYGLTALYEQQSGYLIWQRFVPHNTGDVRVCVCGDVAFGLKRYNRSHVPFASGSGKRDVIKELDEPRLRQAFAKADEIASALNSRWICFDFVFEQGNIFCLELSFSWVEDAYDDCVCFDRKTQQPVGYTAARWGDMIVDELERLVY